MSNVQQAIERLKDNDYESVARKLLLPTPQPEIVTVKRLAKQLSDDDNRIIINAITSDDWKLIPVTHKEQQHGER
jgi:hypothetical protein